VAVGRDGQTRKEIADAFAAEAIKKTDVLLVTAAIWGNLYLLALRKYVESRNRRQEQHRTRGKPYRGVPSAIKN